MTTHISPAIVRDYLMGGFARGLDLAPNYIGSQLVETEKTGGCFIHVDSLGAPKLKADFAAYMDDNSFGARIPHGRVREIIEALHHPEPTTGIEEHANCLYRALYWLIHDRVAGETQTAAAERIGVTDRTMRNWLREAIAHIVEVLRGERSEHVGAVLSFTPVEIRRRRGVESLAS